MSDELKRCQSCGSRATIVDYEGASLFGYYIACRNKRCELSKMPDAQNLFRTEAEAIAAWNTRAEDAQVITSAEKYKLADDSRPQVIAIGEKHKLADEPDSRERLEADVRGAVHGAYAYEDYIPEDMIIGWLDRQAVITERELCEYFHMFDRTDELEEQVNSLTAERDELQSIIDHMPKTEAECEACQEAHDRLMFNVKVDMDGLRDELKHKQLVIDRQRDSFLKMERECAELRRMLADAADAI